MAKVAVSPGVYTKEIDDSFQPAAGGGAIGAALIGQTKKGPAFSPTIVSSFGEFKERFGGTDPSLYMPYAAKAYLRNASTLTVTRILGRATAESGNSILLAFPTTGSLSADAATLSATNTVLGVLKFRGDLEEALLSGSPSNFTLAIPGKGVTATNLSMTESSNNYIGKMLGTDPVESKAGDTLTAVYVDAVYDYKVGDITGTISGAAALSEMASATAEFTNVTGGFSPAQSTMVVSQNYGGTVHNLFEVFTLADGNGAEREIKIGITQVDLTTTAAPEFTVVVRAFGDNDLDPVVLEQFTVNLSPSSKQFIGRVIGDREPAYDFTQTPPELLFNGDFPNRSKFIRVKVQDGFPADARPSGFKGVPKFDGGPGVPDLPTKQDHRNPAGAAVDANVFAGTDFSIGGVDDRIKKTTTSASGSSSADPGMLFISSTADYSGSASLAATYLIIDQVGSNSGNFSSTNKLRFSFPVYGGWDGYDPRTDKLTSLNDGTVSADFVQAIDILSNDTEYDFNLIAVPGVHSSGAGQVPDRVIDMVTTRGDAFYILDISDATTTGSGLALSIAAAQSEVDKYDTNYAATYYPWVRVNDVDNDRIVWVPPSVEVLSAYAFNDRVAQPWWAPAGFNRGGVENVIEARRRLTQGQRDDLISKNVNPIATFPGQGIAVWGQDTLQKKASLLSKVNVRRMLLEVRKTIAGFSRLFVFEPNNPSVRRRLETMINNYLTEVQAANGLTEFRATLDESTTTPDLIDRNTMKGVIALKPTAAAEIILLDFSVNSSGAVFDE